jgi:hypothetical protein
MTLRLIQKYTNTEHFKQLRGQIERKTSTLASNKWQEFRRNEPP